MEKFTNVTFWCARGALFILTVFIVAYTGLANAVVQELANFNLYIMAKTGDTAAQELFKLHFGEIKLTPSYIWHLIKYLMCICLIYCTVKLVDDLLFNFLFKRDEKSS